MGLEWNIFQSFLVPSTVKKYWSVKYSYRSKGLPGNKVPVACHLLKLKSKRASVTVAVPLPRESVALIWMFFSKILGQWYTQAMKNHKALFYWMDTFETTPMSLCQGLHTAFELSWKLPFSDKMHVNQKFLFFLKYLGRRTFDSCFLQYALLGWRKFTHVAFPT